MIQLRSDLSASSKIYFKKKDHTLNNVSKYIPQTMHRTCFSKDVSLIYVVFYWNQRFWLVELVGLFSVL